MNVPQLWSPPLLTEQEPVNPPSLKHRNDGVIWCLGKGRLSLQAVPATRPSEFLTPFARVQWLAKALASVLEPDVGRTPSLRTGFPGRNLSSNLFL